jgi:hypothetical protein
MTNLRVCLTLQDLVVFRCGLVVLLRLLSELPALVLKVYSVEMTLKMLTKPDEIRSAHCKRRHKLSSL